MKAFSPHFAALMLSLIAVSSAHADWVSNYSVAVSNSPSGPFGPTVNLWTQTVSPGTTPLTINLATESSPPGPVFGGNVLLPLGLLTVDYGPLGSPAPSFPQLPISFQVTPQGGGSMVLSGQLNFPNTGNINFSNGGSSTVTVGNQSFGIEVMGRAMPQGFPGNEPSTVHGEYDIYVVVPVGELAQAPEPSGLVLAMIGGIAIFARRRKMI